jgi:hypothetical protein
MNAHLTRLGLEAKDYAYTTVKNFKDNSYEFEQVYLAKFAELILQDCISIIDSDEFELYNNPLTEVKQVIEQHFNIDAK